MVHKCLILFVVVLSGALQVLGQSADSLIYAEGRILNAATKEPVTARVTYQSLPYGNRVGTLNANAYSFPLFDNEKYSLIVEAPGFTTAKFLIDPSEANGNKVLKDIELSTNANGSNKHTVGNVMRLDNVIFQVGKSKLNEDSYSELDVVVNMMKENPTMVIQLEGHTDYLGDAKENLKLSQARVDAVKSYIVSKNVNKGRIKTKAFGGTQPLSRDDTPEAHRLNRRVELRILQN
ncbi:MAG TPA: OmpA family protein [Ohtaekwangia sp.]|uniref:OmpA family protein n=1 Tax=Ohtaekwangia sp. TaxID=2066019 RepID=UPI002F940C25